MAGTIKCPTCGAQAVKVKDTRYEEKWNQIKRRRECANGHRFNTYENTD